MDMLEMFLKAVGVVAPKQVRIQRTLSRHFTKKGPGRVHDSRGVKNHFYNLSKWGEREGLRFAPESEARERTRMRAWTPNSRRRLAEYI